MHAGQRALPPTRGGPRSFPAIAVVVARRTVLIVLARDTSRTAWVSMLATPGSDANEALVARSADQWATARSQSSAAIVSSAGLPSELLLHRRVTQDHRVAATGGKEHSAACRLIW